MNTSAILPLQQHVDRVIRELLTTFPRADRLSPEERRGIIARYTAVLEGNFIYWMTATRLAVTSATAHAIIDENLREEVRDNHPGMLRRFAMAAQAMPTEADVLAVHPELQAVRAFVARLTGMNLLLMMAFFEGFITHFMPYLAELARRQGSSERQYTDVHGVVDIEHSEGLYQALEAEMALAPSPPTAAALVDGVEALRALIQSIAYPRTEGDVALGAWLATGRAA
jgi:hypothetical protein